MCAYAEGAGSSGAGDRSGRGGFLLLEALVGLAIIGIVAVAVLATTAQQVRTADRAVVTLTASALAQDRMAALQFLDAASLADPPDSLLAGRFPVPFDAYVWTAAVEPVDDELDLFAVQVEVQGRDGLFRSETLVHRPTGLMGGVAGEEGDGS